MTIFELIDIIQTLMLLALVIVLCVIACVLGWIRDGVEKLYKAINREYETYKRLPLPDPKEMKGFFPKDTGGWLPPPETRIDYGDVSKYYDDDDGPYDQFEERIK